MEYHIRGEIVITLLIELWVCFMGCAKIISNEDTKVLEEHDFRIESGVIGVYSDMRTGERDAAEKMKWTKTAATLLTLVSIGQCYGPHHPRGPHVHRRPMPPSNAQTNPTLDKELFQDEVHIREDFNHIELDTSKMDLPELASYYFLAHDLDNNTKLDGLEILQALKHTMHEENENLNIEDFSLTEGDLQYFVELVDKLLAKEDLDGDGYLSYTEYFIAQEHNKKQTNT